MKVGFIYLFIFSVVIGCVSSDTMHRADKELLFHYFGNDYQWYAENIPIIDVPDQEIMDVYYYRWSVYKRHIRDIGEKGTIITEFAPPVPWEGPYSGISAAAGHHIYEGRWLKDPKYIHDYLAFWFKGAGKHYHYNSWLSDALYNYFLVKGDKTFLCSFLPYMIADYERWVERRYDPEKDLYWQIPVEDASEFTVSGYMVNEGWRGDAYRPTTNSYMYANALAIHKVADLCNDSLVSNKYLLEAEKRKAKTLALLWNQDEEHFMDRFTNRYEDFYFQFIRDPEINGYVPWMFSLPKDEEQYANAWKKIMDPEIFYAPFGPRTISKQSPYYMLEKRTPGAPQGLGECEWNGPSWPYQTCMILMAIKNLLTEYNQTVLDKNDYFDLLKIYTRSQYKNGQPYIAENLNPDTGFWIADFPNRSEHYNHSSYNDLILNGLLGIHPQADNSLIIQPLIPDEWDYFSVRNLSYHGHILSIYYKKNKGLTVYLNDKQIAQLDELGKHRLEIPPVVIPEPKAHLLNYAFNNQGEGFPQVKASYTYEKDRIYDAIDGRLWFDEFPQNRWTTLHSSNSEEWLEIDFGMPRNINAMEIAFFDNAVIQIPNQMQLEYWNNQWVPIKTVQNLISGTTNAIFFEEITTDKIRAVFPNLENPIGIVEFKVGIINK